MFVHSNTVQEIIRYYQENLRSIYPVNEVNNITEIMFENIKNWDKMQLRRNLAESLSESELLLFHKALKRLSNSEPVQYVIGETEFFSLPFKVSKDVLIPRPETEELVDLICKESIGNETVVDIGTGTGCIPIAIKKQLPNTYIVGTDISQEALKIANHNAKLNDVMVEFIKSDVLSLISLDEIEPGKIDVVVSNPPYITESEKEFMSENVLAFEPSLALFVSDESPLMFYDKVGRLAFKKLLPGGRIYFEINENYSKKTAELLNSIGFSDIRTIKDLQKKDRIIAATR